MKRGMSIFLFAILTAAFTARYPIAGWAQGVERKPPTLHGGQETLQRGIEKKDIRRVAFLFLYRDGSISPEALKSLVERAEIVIRTKSSRARPGSYATPTELEKMTLEELAAMLSGKGGGEADREIQKKDDIASGAKFTKADAARKGESPTLGELFQKHGNVLVLNIANEPSNLPGADWIKVWPPGSLPRYVSLVDLGFSEKKIKPSPINRPIDYRTVDLPDPGIKVLVITFNQSPEAVNEFKALFCALYHGDCGGPIGKPTPVPEPVTVRKYKRLNTNEPIKDEVALLAAIRKSGIEGNIQPGGDPQQKITCMRRDAQGNCNWVRICGNLGPSGEYRCYDVMYLGPGIGWQVVW